MFAWNAYSPAHPDAGEWDAVVVGGGMGGGVVALRLAQRGQRVLVLERGAPVDPLEPPPRKARGLRHLWDAQEDVAGDIARARWPHAFNLRLDGKAVKMKLPLGNGPGGSSAIYAATLERFHREDFAGAARQEQGLTPLANTWPLPFEAMIPYYRAAERLLGVFGGRDPSDPDDDFTPRDGPPMSARDTYFHAVFERAGLLPHRLRMGLDYKPGCAECLGRQCARDCKSDGASRALRPALTDHGAALMTDCTVERLVMEGDRVAAVECRRDGRTLRIRARVVVLAAGALGTPALLLRSTSEAWPSGVGNGADLVGRGLMFHALQIMAMWPRGRFSTVGPDRSLSARIANLHDGERLGGLQSFAQHVQVGLVWRFLQDLADAAAPGLSRWARLPAAALAVASARVFRDAALFGLLTEDFGYAENRVRLDPGSQSGVAIDYARPEELRRRAKALRHWLRRRLAGHRLVFLTAGSTPNFGHACGTCRMGASPAEGVTDRDGRVHGVSNLFVADASALPTSGATNLSLTITANALRITDGILGEESAALTPRISAHA